MFDTLTLYVNKNALFNAVFNYISQLIKQRAIESRIDTHTFQHESYLQAEETDRL